MKSGFLFILILLSVLFSVSCDEVVQPQIQEDILGLWGLREQSGSSANVCKGELVQFNPNGIAVFQCPGFESVQIQFTASNNLLTFTETNVQYTISKPADTNLVLTGVNLDIILKYGSEY